MTQSKTRTGRQRIPTTELSEQAKQARKEYTRAYRQRNPERVRQWARNYWERKGSQIAEASVGETEVTED